MRVCLRHHFAVEVEMFFLKFARKLGKILRGGVRSRQIMLGALLGVIIGMIPGFNLSLVIAIIALLILNAHVGVAMFGVALGKVAMYLLAPVTFQIGFILVHQLGVEGLFRVLANAPVLALLDLHVYSLTGGLPVAVLLGGIFGWVMTRMVDALRTGIIQATDRSPRMKKLANNRAVRLFMRIVFGKQKGDLEELLSRDQPVLRRSGLILVTVVVVLGGRFAVVPPRLHVRTRAGRGTGIRKRGRGQRGACGSLPAAGPTGHRPPAGNRPGRAGAQFRPSRPHERGSEHHR
ncbi:MAG: DUF2062 domain-containing protein, partial [Planctomycetota bacterium]